MESRVSLQDLDATQYRVTKDKIQLVKIKEYRDGKPHYVATHKVNIKNDIPELESEFEDLEGWYPRVTHINGMNVQPAEAVKSGRNLHKEIAKELGNHLDILYTYSSTKGFIGDVQECTEGKFGISDLATERQVQIMLDAVHNCRRVTVSAHSRGTIKTDNAVREVHSQLSNEYLESLKKIENTSEKQNIDTNELNAEHKKLSDKKASEDMNKYIQLIYAGNAVLFPSEVLKGDSYVVSTDNSLNIANADLVSYLTGKHYLSTSSMNLHKLEPNSKGNNHTFDQYYAEVVAKEIARDMQRK
ncbi:hypothetical protein DSM107010_35140 [Chroococcidiopsis cubana SAG 39.79]|uniref:Uncharacterized protein n=2 Tax=Chroococcidiopsis TaxID=54298 RepID=A0AB37UIN7_9CYAN|nr:hypothetical protein C7B79_28790 [Chroococcidiopsis cubana CCALA 043]RUT11245.1 hypothetical protein DSM107010_35140 [Chroococcidiopsis cubana SAG 39.79]